MLKITIVESYNDMPGSIIRDTEYAFEIGSIKIDERSIEIVSRIDEAVDITQDYFLDRFGCKLYLSNLSTGSKTALLVNSVCEPVSLAECGYNALDTIINYCTGHVVMQEPYYSFTDFGGGRHKEFEVNGIRIVGISNLNEYLGV